MARANEQQKQQQQQQQQQQKQQQQQQQKQFCDVCNLRAEQQSPPHSVLYHSSCRCCSLVLLGHASSRHWWRQRPQPLEQWRSRALPF